MCLFKSRKCVIFLVCLSSKCADLYFFIKDLYKDLFCDNNINFRIAKGRKHLHYNFDFINKIEVAKDLILYFTN